MKIPYLVAIENDIFCEWYEWDFGLEIANMDLAGKFREVALKEAERASKKWLCHHLNNASQITSRWPLISLLHSVLHGSHVVIHEYFAPPETALYLGDRLHVVDNGDPDWLHGFKVSILRARRFVFKKRHSSSKTDVYWERRVKNANFHILVKIRHYSNIPTEIYWCFRASNAPTGW